MKIFRTLATLMVIAAFGVTLIVLRPTKEEFARYYVEKNQTGLGSFFDAAAEAVIRESTTCRDYLFFAVFDVNEEDRYVGILGNFFGHSSAEQVQKTVNNIVEKAKEWVDSSEEQ